MPIKIPDDLPASTQLINEGVALILEKKAIRQDIRPMQIALLNLMPTKEATEVQLARLLGGSPLQIELTLLTTGSYTAKNAPEGHLQKFYSTFAQVKDRKFDGLIITGAPVERMDFAAVDYWQELTDILAWTQTNVHSTFTICWGAQAAIYHHRGVGKHELSEKAFGLYRHRVLQKNHPLVRGFDDEFAIPVSRYTAVDAMPDDKDLSLLVESVDGQPCLINDRQYRTTYMFNHIEYDVDTLGLEYRRDQQAGLNTNKPKNYFPNDDIAQNPKSQWRSHAYLLFTNWINLVYQSTPFDINKIGKHWKKIKGR
ncbi:MAG: homoserine O-succinyltransferase [Hydrotalea sp.]|nr:homoserine O-succinyltransferase [Hydrotalea sp.]